MFETEIKFVYDKKTIHVLLKQATSIGVKEFTDVYYDDDKNTLFRADTYLRRRNNSWELKIPAAKDNSGLLKQYTEITSLKEIQEYVDINQYSPFLTVHTRRESYLLEDVRIDIDKATIEEKTFYVCELELVFTDEDERSTVSQKLFTIQKKYGLQPEPYGKVFLYLKQERPELFKQLTGC